MPTPPSKTPRNHTTKFRSKSSASSEKKIFSRDTTSRVPHQSVGRCWLFNPDALVTVCAVELDLGNTPRQV